MEQIQWGSFQVWPNSIANGQLSTIWSIPNIDMDNPTGWGPPVISWLINHYNPINYSYTYTTTHRIQPLFALTRIRLGAPSCADRRSFSWGNPPISTRVGNLLNLSAA